MVAGDVQGSGPERSLSSLTEDHAERKTSNGNIRIMGPGSKKEKRRRKGQADHPRQAASPTLVDSHTQPVTGESSDWGQDDRNNERHASEQAATQDAEAAHVNQ